MSRALSKALRATSRVESLRVVRSISVKSSSPRFRPLLSSAPLRFVPTAAMSSAPMISAPECLFHPLDFPHKTLMGPGPSNAPPRVLGASALPLLGHLHPEFTQVGVLPYGLANQIFLLRVCALFFCWLLYCLVFVVVVVVVVSLYGDDGGGVHGVCVCKCDVCALYIVCMCVCALNCVCVCVGGWVHAHVCVCVCVYVCVCVCV